MPEHSATSDKRPALGFYTLLTSAQWTEDFGFGYENTIPLEFRNSVVDHCRELTVEKQLGGKSAKKRKRYPHCVISQLLFMWMETHLSNKRCKPQQQCEAEVPKFPPCVPRLQAVHKDCTRSVREAINHLIKHHEKRLIVWQLSDELSHCCERGTPRENV